MFDQEKLDSCTAAKEFRACLFGLCFFHSLVLGRRRFGQLGWSRSYGFAAGDLNICANILHSYWEAAVSADGRGAPWQELRYIFGEIMYGGHITDFFDRRVTTSYLEVSSQTRVYFEEETERSRGDLLTKGYAKVLTHPRVKEKIPHVSRRFRPQLDSFIHGQPNTHATIKG